MSGLTGSPTGGVSLVVNAAGTVRSELFVVAVPTAVLRSAIVEGIGGVKESSNHACPTVWLIFVVSGMAVISVPAE
jgi:hypothetical protein